MRKKIFAALAAVVLVAAGTSTALATSTITSPTSVYTPVTPMRILDTRTGSPIAANGSYTLNPGLPSGATGVVFNVTVVAPSQNGLLIVDPTGIGGATGTSNVNFQHAVNTANEVTSQLGSDGNVVLYNNSSAAINVVVDEEGYFSPGAGGSVSFYYLSATGPGPFVTATCTAGDLAVGGGGQAGNTGNIAVWSRPTTVNTANDSWASGSAIDGATPITTYVVCEHKS